MAHRLTTCTFCGAGCGLYLETSRGRVIGAYPSMSHPTNRGRICLRGWHVHEVAGSPDRLLRPMVRDGRRPGDPPAPATAFREVEWDEAAAIVADRLLRVREQHGPDALAFLNSPRCSNEESYLLQKLARSVIGTNNVDHGAGVYCNNSIHVLLDMLGTPATTNAIGDLERSDVIIVDGIDLGVRMPTVGGVVLRSKLAGATLIAVDGRRHRIAESADLFLNIRPGTEVALYGAMAKVVVDRGLVRRGFVAARCAGYDDMARSVLRYDLSEAADRCGVPADLIERAAIAYATASAASILYSTGIEAREADAIRATVNLALMTGQMGRAGAGIYALTEHNNLQGVCDMGMLPDRLPGYLPVADPEARARFERLWGTPVPGTPGLTARQVLSRDAPARAVWLCRYDPARTAFEGDAASTLQRCDFVVTQHLFMTDTAAYADVVLPTTAFGEEQVSFTSTDRRIQLARAVVEGPCHTEPAWRQISRIANTLGAGWDYPSSAHVMDEIGRAVPDYSGASHENLVREYGRQWPCTTDRPLGTPTLFAEPCPESDGACGGAGRRFHMAPLPAPERSDNPEGFPYTLVFGNPSYYWHQNVLIRHSETLKREHRILLLDYPQGFVEVNADDARTLGVRDGEAIRLRSEHGAVEVAARVTPDVRSGTVMVPYFVRAVQQSIRGDASNGAYVAVRIEKPDPTPAAGGAGTGAVSP
jgi:predicted molibdopterin-dependent oxidoreductase YjgC